RGPPKSIRNYRKMELTALHEELVTGAVT
ncbi:hypothetical protein TNCV_4276991, partial [Trichonephila clavipes]